MIDSKCSLWLTAIVFKFFFVTATRQAVGQADKLNPLSQVSFCSSHSRNTFHFALSIYPGWFIYSRTPKSDMSFWDGAPSPLILSLSWKQTFLRCLQGEWGGGRGRRMMKAPLTFRTWLVFSPAHGCSTAEQQAGVLYVIFILVSLGQQLRSLKPNKIHNYPPNNRTKNEREKDIEKKS